MENSELRIVNWQAAALIGLVLAGVLVGVPSVFAEQSSGELTELNFEFPEAFFGGTPIDGYFPNLEPEDYRDRPPFLAPAGTGIVSRGKPVTSSTAPLRGNLEQVTDGSKNYEDAYAVELPKGLQWVQIDLQEEHELYAILLWHNHHGKIVYFDVIAQISNDPEFKEGVTQIYNNDIDNSSGLGAGKDKEYVETNKGRLFDLKGLRGRYVRFYSHGNVYTETNPVVEVEVWGMKSGPEAEYLQVPLGIELPEPFFGGTPLDYFSPNLERMDFKDRPPFLAPTGTLIVSCGKPVTSSGIPLRGKLEQATDGNKNYKEENVIKLPSGLQWVQVDLKEEFHLYAILLWHFHEGHRVYFDVVGQVSNDPEFKKGVTLIYNNDFDNSSGLGTGVDKEYVETYKGRLFDLKGLRGRYVRFYSQGNFFDDFNHVIEIEVWGKEPTSENDSQQAPLSIELPEQFFGGIPL